MHVYEVRPRKDHRGFDLISDALPFGRLWYLKVADAIAHAKHRSRAHGALTMLLATNPCTNTKATNGVVR